MNSETPRLSVVIPSYRRLDRLPSLLEAYERQGADEIVIVLDGPHPGWQESLRRRPASARVVELPSNVGLARARIAGLNAASGDVVLAVDDDVEPEDGLVRRHRDFHRSGGDRVLLGYMPVALPEKRGRDESPTFLYARDYDAQTRVWRSAGSTSILRSLWGGNVSLPRSLYERAETLKPSVRLEYNEDLDLGLRLLALGATAVFDDGARAAHHHSRGLRGFLRESEARGGAVAALEARWGERPAQLAPLVEVSPSYNRVLGSLQHRIAAADRTTIVERVCVATYRVAGLCHLWSLQDGIARFLRRALAMRGCRRARRNDDPGAQATSSA